jgi:hypothetical protein
MQAMIRRCAEAQAAAGAPRDAGAPLSLASLSQRRPPPCLLIHKPMRLRGRRSTIRSSYGSPILRYGYALKMRYEGIQIHHGAAHGK